jgi:ABC-type uncharacterized transport system ATPase subunit
VFEAHSVFENLELAMKVDKRVRHSLTAELDSAQRDKIAATLAMIHLDDSADRPAGTAFARPEAMARDRHAADAGTAVAAA